MSHPVYVQRENLQRFGDLLVPYPGPKGQPDGGVANVERVSPRAERACA